jgi:U3 small nucleolar RNA-associated protein 23
MKGKRHSSMRKKLELYKTNFQFWSPYRIILDGNFLKIAADISLPIQDRLEKILQDKVVLCTTKCIQDELKLFGPKFQPLLDQTYEMRRLYCEHDLSLQPSLCIAKHIGNRNKDNYLVGTQDKSLEKTLNDVPRVPVVTLVNGSLLNILDPSERTLELIRKKEAKKFKLGEEEAMAVGEVRREVKEENYQRKLDKVRNYRNKLGVKVKVAKAKGPNPKSVKGGVKRKIKKEEG